MHYEYSTPMKFRRFTCGQKNMILVLFLNHVCILLLSYFTNTWNSVYFIWKNMSRLSNLSWHIKVSLFDKAKISRIVNCSIIQVHFSPLPLRYYFLQCFRFHFQLSLFYNNKLKIDFKAILFSLVLNEFSFRINLILRLFIHFSASVFSIF